MVGVSQESGMGYRHLLNCVGNPGLKHVQFARKMKIET